MKNNVKVYLYLVMGGIMSVVLTQPTQAEAWNRSRGHSYKRHGHGHFRHNRFNRHHNPHFSSRFVLSLPRGFIKISVGGERYHYHDGVFYHKNHRRYIAVPAPIGARIAHLPHGYQMLYIDGVPYYTYNDVYYEHTPKGYEVIHKPYSKRAKKVKVVNKYRDNESEDSITLNIRNKKGEYISITVKPSGNGYVGPQGEYYDEFPKIEHLKVIYGS